MYRKKEKLVDRPDNEPKFDGNNKTDRKIVLTLVLVGAVILVLAIVAIAATLGMMQ